jgi:flavodoxin
MFIDLFISSRTAHITSLLIASRFFEIEPPTYLQFFYPTGSPMSIIEGKRSLICYFSRSGSTKRVVDALHSKITSDVFEIKPDVNYQGFFGVFRCMISTPSAPAVPDFANYDVIFVAGPVWAWTLPAPLIAFLDAVDFGGKHVVALPTAASNIGKFNEDMAAKVKNGQFVAKPGFLGVGKDSDDQLSEKVTAWLVGL